MPIEEQDPHKVPGSLEEHDPHKAAQAEVPTPPGGVVWIKRAEPKQPTPGWTVS